MKNLGYGYVSMSASHMKIFTIKIKLVTTIFATYTSVAQSQLFQKSFFS
jgi:hypothetical protein